MTGHREVVRERWRRLCAALGVDDADATGQWLLDAHCAADRHYHDLRHVAECLRFVDAIGDLGTADRCAVEVALFFHDVIYDPTASDNEQRSAVAAREFLVAAGRDDLVDTVVEAIEMTAGHTAGRRSAVLDAVHDADLSILGSDPNRYDEYAAAIRREYGHVRDADFRAGRASVLRSFLATPRLYVGTGTDELEAAARRNLRRELEALAGV